MDISDRSPLERLACAFQQASRNAKDDHATDNALLSDIAHVEADVL